MLQVYHLNINVYNLTNVCYITYIYIVPKTFYQRWTTG